ATAARSRADAAPADAEKEAAQLVLFPNPVQDRMQLQLNHAYSGQVQATVIDQSGAVRKVYRLAKDRQQLTSFISVGDLPAGIYWLRIQGGDWTTTKKFVKQ
ncbi:MAG TPA: T9SS type A sorting domain-containing protein, partial [Chitinophagaceae bacterium]|nr:T9SS type A sorting domain-containing protein [Chitinophagaceae bacterium]